MSESRLTAEQIELASKLTNLQRKFVLELIKPNMTQRDAIRNAGSRAKTDGALDNSASIMLINPLVANFHAAMVSETINSAILTRERALEILSSNAELSDEKRDQHAAIKQLSAMQGWDAPAKTELSGSEGKSIKVDVSAPEIVSALSDLMRRL